MYSQCHTPQSKAEANWPNRTTQPVTRKHSSPGTQNLKKYRTYEEETAPKTEASYCKPRGSQNEKERDGDKRQKRERGNFGAFFRKEKPQPDNKN